MYRPLGSTIAGSIANTNARHASLCINMVLGTQPPCHPHRRADLPHVLKYGDTKPGVTQVSKPVYASPTRVDVNLDSSRTGSAEPDVTYPHICFAVDNFDSAFDSLVLRGDDHCYSVCLWAQPPFGQSGQADGPAGRLDTSGQQDTAAAQHAEQDPQQQDPLDPLTGYLADRLARTHLDASATPPEPTAQPAPAMVLLFAGYVSFSQLQAVVDTTGGHVLFRCHAQHVLRAWKRPRVPTMLPVHDVQTHHQACIHCGCGSKGATHSTTCS